MKCIRALILWAFVMNSHAAAGNLPERSDSTGSSSPGQRGFFKTVGTVSLQVLVGTMGGAAGMVLVKVHPVLGGVGWVAGSSIGVYTAGDGGTGRGNFWLTAAAGTTVALALTPAMARGGMSGGIAAGLALITSLVAEIVAYHISEEAICPRASISIGFLETRQAPHTATERGARTDSTLEPCLVFAVSL